MVSDAGHRQTFCKQSIEADVGCCNKDKSKIGEYFQIRCLGDREG